MKLYYVKIDKDWDKLASEDSVIFELPTRTIRYNICVNGSHAYLVNYVWYNDDIFSELKICDNKFTFVESIVKYKCESGNFPEVKGLKDLKKVIKALDDECVKKFGIPKEESTEPKPEFKVGDKVRILPRNGLGSSYRFGYIDEMLDYVGKTTTIRRVKIDNNPSRSIPDDGYLYRLESNSWSWASSMFELAEDSDFKEGKEVNPTHIPSHPKYGVFVDTDKEELNLFPIKKHYQLNFNY